MDGPRLLDPPMPPSSAAARRGIGRVRIESVAGRSRAVSRVAHSPLKLLVPALDGPAAHVIASTLGGGLVAGDRIDIDLTLGELATALVGTQSATKVYRSTRERPCRQSLRARIEGGATLVCWPDPLIPFADSAFDQDQHFDLADPSASLVLVDWVVAGRVARGERWAMTRYRSRNAVSLAGRPALNDTLLLDTDDGPIAGGARAGRFDCLATVVLIGPATRPWADTADADVRAAPVSRQAPLLVTTSRLPTADGVILRIGASDPRQAGAWIRRALRPVSSLLGGDPWARKW